LCKFSPLPGDTKGNEKEKRLCKSCKEVLEELWRRTNLKLLYLDNKFPHFAKT
jgi:hypothetical protein